MAPVELPRCSQRGQAGRKQRGEQEDGQRSPDSPSQPCISAAHVHPHRASWPAKPRRWGAGTEALFGGAVRGVLLLAAPAIGRQLSLVFAATLSALRAAFTTKQEGTDLDGIAP